MILRRQKIAEMNRRGPLRINLNSLMADGMTAGEENLYFRGQLQIPIDDFKISAFFKTAEIFRPVGGRRTAIGIFYDLPLLFLKNILGPREGWCRGAVVIVAGEAAGMVKIGMGRNDIIDCIGGDSQTLKIFQQTPGLLHMEMLLLDCRHLVADTAVDDDFGRRGQEQHGRIVDGDTVIFTDRNFFRPENLWYRPEHRPAVEADFAAVEPEDFNFADFQGRQTGR